MTWTLNASGHTSDEDAERALASALADAINNLPDEDVSTATFTGNHISGDLRSLDLDDE